LLGGNGVNNETRLSIAGADLNPAANVRFMPNILFKRNAMAGMEYDLTARITL
jgi:hypothetical protein